MQAMIAAAPMISLAGTALSAVNSAQAGSASAAASSAGAKNAKDYARYQATQLNRRANSERATGQRGAIEEWRRSRLAQSQARAVAAASGGGVSDPSVTKIIGDLAGEGEYNALTALYEGEDAARGYEDQARAGIYEGDVTAAGLKAKARASRRAGIMGAVGSTLYGATSFANKYGEGLTDDTADAGTMPPPALSFNQEFNRDRML